jgi:hypothetical protein
MICLLESCEKKVIFKYRCDISKVRTYYSLEVTSPFGDSLYTRSIRRKGENNGSEKVVTVKVILYPMLRENQLRMW